MRIRVRGTSGVATLEVENGWTVRDLKTAIESKLKIPAEAQVLLSGFPPKKIDLIDSASAADYIKSGDTIVVQQGTPAMQRSVQHPRQTATADPPAFEKAKASSIASQGKFVIREVPDDNSCLFRSVNGILGRSHDAATPLRLIVSSAVGADQAMYSDAFLGRSNEAYRQWILTENAWGGAIELGILAKHFKIEIGAFDVKTMRMDRYGEGNGYPQLGYLIYDGIHYNYLALALGGNTSSTELDVTQFDANDVYAMEMARRVAQVKHESRQFTDTQNFKLKCDDCGVKLRGEQDAVKHATATSHGNFSEAK